jgi:hypothetical protein
MSLVKRITLCILAILALNAVVVSAASAASPAWWVEGKPLESGVKEAIAETTTVTSAFVIKGSSLGVECPTVRFDEAYIEGEKLRKEKSIVFEGCKVTGQPSCKVATIETGPLTATLEGTKEHFKLKFKPTSGTEIATITISGSGCTGSLVIDGTMACNYPKVEAESTNHILEFTLTSGSELKHGSEEITLKGTDEFWLKSGKKWSVR